MDCVNHPGVNAAAYCQNCGKALCAGRVRHAPAGGGLLCDSCSTAWQAVPAPFAVPPSGGPNPVVAGILGFIPGVGAMYNGQFLKGFIHVVIFAILVSMAHHVGLVFGILIAGRASYQCLRPITRPGRAATACAIPHLCGSMRPSITGSIPGTGPRIPASPAPVRDQPPAQARQTWLPAKLRLYICAVCRRMAIPISGSVPIALTRRRPRRFLRSTPARC